MDEIAQIKERVEITDLISSYLTLKKAGSNMRGLCPFHNEKTPSFMVSPERQSFKCFGCGEGGDIFTFIEKIEGVDFYNALKILADKAGIKLQSKSVQYGNQKHLPDQKTRLFEINEWAAKLYHKVLIDHPKAEHARKYLENRGLTDETIKNFRIGYAPNSWDFLRKFLGKKGYKPPEIAKAGAMAQNQKGDFYDRFRGRIIFPINNVMGNCIGFTSRVLVDDGKQAKYINSGESEIYHKGKVLYGLDKAKLDIKKANMAVVVEGNMDVIACHQAGFSNVVASSGTAITEEQLMILSRYSPEIAFSFDSDTAGENAMKKAITLALQNDISARIIALPEVYKDPDEAIKAGKKNWEIAVKGAKPSLEYWIDLLVRKSPDLSVDGKKRIAKEILPVIKMIFSEIEKEHYIKYLADKLSVSEGSLIAALEKTKNSAQVKNEDNNKVAKKDLSLTERMLGIIWYKPEILNNIDVEEFKIINRSDREDCYKEAIEALVNGKFEKKSFDEEVKNKLNQLSMQVMAEYDNASEENFIQEIKFILKRIKDESKEKIKANFAQKMKEAESAGDREKIKKLLSEFSELIK